MYSMTGRVDSLGPPASRMEIWANTLSEARICRISTRLLVERSSGMVIERICCHGEAPSMAAASYVSSGMSWMAAVYRMKLKPNVHHNVSRVTASQAPEVLPRKFGADSPTPLNSLLMSPVCGVYMNAKMRQTTEDGTT